MASCGSIGLRLMAKVQLSAALLGAIAILAVFSTTPTFSWEGSTAASDWVVVPHENAANAPVVLTQVMMKVLPSQTGGKVVDKRQGPVFSIRNKEKSRIVRSVDFALEVKNPSCRILFQALVPLGPTASIKVNTDWNEAMVVRGPGTPPDASAGDLIPEWVVGWENRIVAKIAYIYWEDGGIWTGQGYPVPAPSQPRTPSTPNPPVPPVAPSMVAPRATPDPGK